ncbi:MAG TPA: DUF1553 domain-containing protein [Pirellulaceae bacterium]|nr:DUF1553 domain-containing protein [Planctomycetales bacterium]MCB9940137.1 DUF1553 domain-containing protein [Planctomycetaceae bacterium]HRX77586.1 DUF1553 domain-containing protein [Pirellulaceae bacterium]
MADARRLLPVFAIVGTCLLHGVAIAAGPEAAVAAREIDQKLVAETGVAADKLAPRTDDETYLRRVFLDLLGETPTPDDVLAFAFMSEETKRAEIVDQLLDDKAFGENWARYWRDVILYRRSEDRALLVSNSLVESMTKKLNENKPWSDVATDFITATGDVRENGDTAIIMAQAGMPEDVTAEVSRIFLGIQIQCAQCHDHPTDRWKRQQFHELAAFFPRIAVRQDRDSQPPTFLVTVNDSPFQFRRQANVNNRFRGTPEHFMPNLEDPTDAGTQMQPVFFISGDKLAKGTTDADRREALAAWISSPNNPWFATAFVNRVWSELVGEGFYEPIDDLGPDRECSASETVDYLAKSFTETGYDVKWLYRTILATEAYQRESRARRDYEELPFQANCAQRLRADQLFDSLVSALDLGDRMSEQGPARGPYMQRFSPRAVFNAAFGYDPSQPREEVGSSIQQALAIMNAPFINQSINARRSDGLGAILRDNPDDEDALTELYLKTLSRSPSKYEIQTCVSYIGDVRDRNEAFEDILWSLINSTEFLHRK